MTCGDKMCITVKGKDIMESENVKFLGVTIDCGLHFVCKKASQGIGVIEKSHTN